MLKLNNQTEKKFWQSVVCARITCGYSLAYAFKAADLAINQYRERIHTKGDNDYV